MSRDEITNSILVYSSDNRIPIEEIQWIEIGRVRWPMLFVQKVFQVFSAPILWSITRVAP